MARNTIPEKDKEREESSMGSAPVNLPPTKPVDIQFIGHVGLVQGVENAVVHQLNPVYHPLELQTHKKYKKENAKHTHG